MVILQGLLPRLLTASKETPHPDYDSSYDKSHPVFERAKLNLAIAATTPGSLKDWPTFPCSLWFDINAKVKVLCVNWQNCKYEEDRNWQGRIIGKGIHGSLNALLTMIKHKNKTPKGHTPLMELLTVCAECCGDQDLHYEADYVDQIIKMTSGSLILSLSNKEVEDVISSRAIIMKGMLMNAVNTVAIDGQWKEWDMLRPIFKN